MFDRMALPPYLLLFIGISAAAPIQNVTESTSIEEISTTGKSTAIPEESTSQSSVTKGDQDVNLALAQALGNGNIYDQRQEGELNVHVRVDNATVYFVMLDGLGELAWRKGTKGNIQAFLKQAGLKRSPLSRKAVDPPPGAAASPQAVSASPPAAVSASTPPPPDATPGHTNPPRSTYIPPVEIKPESSQTTFIEIGITEVASNNPLQTTPKQTQTSTQSNHKQESEPTSTQPNETTKQQSEKLKRLVTPVKSQARSEEQMSILNLLKRTAALPPHNNSAFRRQTNSQSPSVSTVTK